MDFFKQNFLHDKTKTKTYIKILRQCSLHINLIGEYLKFGVPL